MPFEPPAGGLKRDYEEDEIEERRDAPDFQPERRITKKRPVSQIVPRVPANLEPEALDEDMACFNYFADTDGPACSSMAGSAMELLMKAEDLDTDVLFGSLICSPTPIGMTLSVSPRLFWLRRCARRRLATIS